MLTKIYRLNANFLIFLQGLLVFILVFEDKIQLPFVWIGRLHPLLLHLPIGFGVLLCMLFVLQKSVSLLDFKQIFRFVLHLTASLTALTAVFGLFLSKEGGYDADLISFHQWAGISVNVFYVAFLWWTEREGSTQKQWLYGACLGVLAFLVAGHGGGDLTHGEGYLLASEDVKGPKALTDESILYEAVIQSILKQKCESCHNDQKTKGQLNMSSITKIQKGGKHGAIWKAGDAEHSHLVERMLLPLDAKEHMPPKGKAQLSADEQLILQAWIQEGASTDKSLKSYGPTSETVRLARKMQSKGQALVLSSKTYGFSAASEDKIAAVNTPFCSVYPLASDAPALQADFYVSKKFDVKTLENLSKVGEQIVGLNLSKMPVKNADMSLIGKFPNLEKLILNFTEVRAEALGNLDGNKQLKSLAIAGIPLKLEEAKNLISKIPSLREVFVWNTGLSAEEVVLLKKQFPKVRWEAGYVPKDEKLQINPPILVNENFILRPNEQVVFKHTLKGVDFQYTVNDSLPDSLGTMKTRGPITLTNFTKIKAMATKEGWLASKVVEYKFYKSRFIPDTVYLLTKPEPKYAAHGGSSLKDFVQGARETKGVPNFTWLGFKDEDLDAVFEFKQSKPVTGVTFSYLRKTDSDVFPPVKIEVFAGNDRNVLKPVAIVKPEMPTERKGYTQMGLNIPIKPGTYRFYRVKAYSLRRLPKYLMKDDKKEPVENHGKPAGLRVDEILFY
jgi:hypothetical protein